MQGFQLTFMTQQDRRIEGTPAVQWLLKTARDIGCAGATSFAGMESYGSDGKRHSAHFIELADQPVQVMLAVTPEQATALLNKISQVETRLFYTRAAIEFGSVGAESATP